MPHTYRKVRLDALLWALGGFAEPDPKPIDLRNARLAKLWAAGLTAPEIGGQLGMTIANVHAWRFLLGLPKRPGGRPRRKHAA